MGGALVVAVTLACATTFWSKDGATAEALERDRAECLEESGNTTGVMNLRTSRFITRCLEERGWKKNAKRPPPSAALVQRPRSAAPAAAAPAPAADPGMSFDQCFERCRELTDRSKEQCFDVCLAAD